MTKRVKLFLISAMVCLMAVATVFLTLNVNVANASQKTLTGTKAQAEVTEEVNLDTFEVVDSASIRTESPSGIRFLTTVSKAQVSNLPDNAVFGTLLLPSELLGGAELTLETQKVANVKAITYSESGDNYQYLTALVGQKVADGNYEDFNEAFYGKEISARSYVTYTYGSGTVKTVYTNTVSYSVEQTARNLLAKASELQLSQDEIPTLKAIATKNAIKATTLKTAQVFEASSVVESVVNVDIPLSAGITADDVTGVYGENYVSFAKVDSDTIAITLKDATVRGDISFMVFTADATILVDVCLADQVIDDATEFRSMLQSRALSTLPADAGKYFALANDITDLANTRDVAGVSAKFGDIFDGRGHALSNGNSTIYTTGIFGTIYGGVVRNLVVKNAIMRGEGAGKSFGVIAAFAQEGAIVENNVVIGTTIHSNVGAVNNGSNAYGMLVGNTFTNTTIIRNNVVIDNVVTPTQPGYYTGAKYDASSVGTYLSYFIGTARTSFDPNYAVAQGRFVGNYAISANGYSGSRTQLTSGAPDGANSIYNDTIATTGKGLLDLGFNASNYPVFEVDEWGTVSVAGLEIISAETIEIAEEIAIGKQATVTVDAIANKTVSKITIADKEVVFTQAGNKITFSADATATLTSGIDLEMIITADVKYKASITVYNEIATKADYEKMMQTEESRAKYYKQTADLDMSGATKQYSNTITFTGGYDGQGYSIIGGTTNGYFAYVTGTIKNVVLVNTTVTHASGRSGALSCQTTGTATIDNIYVINPTVTHTSDNYGGAVIGATYGTSDVNSITNILVVDGGNMADGVKAIIGNIGGSTTTNANSKIASVYCISSKSLAPWNDASNGAKYPVANYPTCADYNAFTTAAGANLANFKLLKTDASGNVTVGNGNLVTTI